MSAGGTIIGGAVNVSFVVSLVGGNGSFSGHGIATAATPTPIKISHANHVGIFAFFMSKSL